MSRVRKHLLRVAMVLSLGILPAIGMECDLEDGELEWEIDDVGWYDDCYYCDDDYYYYEEVVYDPWYYSWF